ncbi:MAG: sodium:solute symporter [Pelagibacteraceae bacterium]|nr:sodium:solute symporter [Pelagibacteraceae bacterium]OUV88516.1 MAG: sodium:solute symporter [Pelagibacteraceae bacterium TMED146]RZO93267.1 MAG: sodium:solute symporter [alpha proteobacterium HIMB114]|tara:strand:- start:2588 stop:3991 length:1404 start_codon:yes stop_codon:yes gene_type:complete
MNTILIISLFVVCLGFMSFGYYVSRGKISQSAFLVSDRNVNVFGLTFSLTASCFGIWILIGPAEASTWGGVGAVIGYAAGQSFVFLYFSKIGEKIRKILPNAKSLTEVIEKRYDQKVLKLILILTILYLYVYFCAEVTAISKVVNLILGTPLWLTAALTIISTLIYSLKGGLKISIITDKLQFWIIIIFLLIIFVILNQKIDFLSPSLITSKSSNLSIGFGGFTAGLTFFIAVFATNLFDQGIWQRVYASKNIEVLKKGFTAAYCIVLITILLLGLVGIYASLNGKIKDPSTIIFSLLINKEYLLLNLVILILSLTLVLSSLDSLIASVSSLFVIHSNKFIKKKNINNFYIIGGMTLAGSAFYISSKGMSVLYLFLLADLLCCAAAIPIFYGFYNKKIKHDDVFKAIIFGITLGLLLFPSLDFSKSLLVGILFNKSMFPAIISNYLLFWSFIVALFSPIMFIKKINR